MKELLQKEYLSVFSHAYVSKFLQLNLITNHLPILIKLFITPNHVCLLQKLEKTLMSLQILKMYSGGAYPFFFLSFVVLNSLAKQSKA